MYLLLGFYELKTFFFEKKIIADELSAMLIGNSLGEHLFLNFRDIFPANNQSNYDGCICFSQKMRLMNQPPTLKS